MLNSTWLAAWVSGFLWLSPLFSFDIKYIDIITRIVTFKICPVYNLNLILRASILRIIFFWFLGKCRLIFKISFLFSITSFLLMSRTTFKVQFGIKFPMWLLTCCWISWCTGWCWEALTSLLTRESPSSARGEVVPTEMLEPAYSIQFIVEPNIAGLSFCTSIVFKITDVNEKASTCEGKQASMGGGKIREERRSRGRWWEEGIECTMLGSPLSEVNIYGHVLYIERYMTRQG